MNERGNILVQGNSFYWKLWLLIVNYDNSLLIISSACKMFKTLEHFPNWDQIKETLKNFAHKKCSSAEILQHLRDFQYFSVMDQNNKNTPITTNFKALITLYGAELPQIFSKVAQFVLERPKHEIPLFFQNQEKEHTFNKQTILYLYCSMMLCLIPMQQFNKYMSVRSKFNFVLDFSYIFEDEQHKTQNVIEYIMSEIGRADTFDEKMTIHRHVEKREIQQIIQQNKLKKMGPLKMESNNASIEQFYGDLKADFANKFLGGGALMSGCVQEQLMFTNHPELFTAQLLCEAMRPNECIFLSGYKKYFSNKGYGWSAAYDGRETHQYQYDENKQAKEYITAIDAIPFKAYKQTDQYQKESIDRELLKAYCGFSFKKPNISRVVTGNWGCGAFGGNLRLKFLIQWLACSAVDKQMVYCPFGSREEIYDEQLIKTIASKNIGEVYLLFTQACKNIVNEPKNLDVYKAIKDLL